jgi:hypothetical protein
MRKIVHLTGLLENVKASHYLYPAVAARIHSRFYYLKVAAAAAAAAVLTIVLLHGLTGPVQPLEQGSPDTQASEEKAPERMQLVEKEPSAPRELPGKEEELAGVPGKELKEEKKGVTAKAPEAGPQERKPGLAQKPEKRVVKAPAPEPRPEKRPDEVVPAPVEKEPGVLARIGVTSGGVKVKRRDSEEWLEAGVLLSILPGDALQTNSLGRVRIDFDDGVYFCINNNSHVTLSEEENEVVLKVEKGEVYCEKDTDEGSVAVDTGFGKVRCRKGAFDVKMFGKNKCLLHVISGEVECREAGKGHCGKHGGLTRAWFRRDKRCEKGTGMRSKEAIQWAAKLRPKRPKKPAEPPQAQKPPKPDDSGVPPGVVPKKPPTHDGPKPGDPGGNGKVGPKPVPMPPPPGGGGSNPGGGGNQPGQTPGGGGSNPGGGVVCPGGSK